MSVLYSAAGAHRNVAVNSFADGADPATMGPAVMHKGAGRDEIASLFKNGACAP